MIIGNYLRTTKILSNVREIVLYLLLFQLKVVANFNFLGVIREKKIIVKLAGPLPWSGMDQSSDQY